MKITPNIKNAFDQRASGKAVLESITEDHGETKFTAYVARLGRSIAVGCKGNLTPKQAEAEAGRVAAYLASMAPRSASHGNV